MSDPVYNSSNDSWEFDATTANPVVGAVTGGVPQTSYYEPLFVNGISWEGVTTAGHEAKIVDADGKTLWYAKAAAANAYREDFIKQIWKKGFKVVTLDSGKLHIFCGKVG